MSLLKRERGRYHTLAITSFTFHYVSIKTVLLRCTFTIVYNLHSTMSLLKRLQLHPQKRPPFQFTFHYVSIKTKIRS